MRVQLKLGVKLLSVSLLLASCGATNNAMTNKYKTVEHYRIFDVQTSVSRFDMSDLVSDGIGRSVSDMSETRPIPDGSPLPKKAGRFKVVTQKLSGNMAFFMARAGQAGLKSVQCEGAAWTGSAHRPHPGTTGGIQFTACLFPYTKGYHLDFYASYTTKEGFTLNPLELGKKLGSAIAGSAGSPQGFVDQTVSEAMQYIHDSTKAKVLYIEGYPKYAGLPWEQKETASN
ncbi:hypothetical protein [Ghiorsea bivora]|uniref:hypothetical protein n=1 Tax=Ghiorsea bivora TaxID=1485545 RepID=UPI00056E3250|nr:hypothetical protein [Ghiorsea bivora]